MKNKKRSDCKKTINLRFCQLLREALPQINALHNQTLSKGVKEFISLVEHLLVHHGEMYTVKRLKAYRTIIHQSALGQVLQPIEFCKSELEFPVVLQHWKVTQDSPIDKIRYIISFWRSIDLLRISPQYEVSTIVTKTTPDVNLMEDIKSFIKSWSGLKLLGSKPSPGYLVMSNKAGPNGPATVSCLDDLHPLRESKDLYAAVEKLLHISVPDLRMDIYDDITPGKQHSKLVLLSDKAGKTRVVAIADWWSNTALSGIHKSFLQALRKLDTDVTFRQDQIPNLIKGLGTHLYTSDMTAFTDVFPRELEKTLVDAAWPGLGDLWEEVISNRVFEHQNGGVKYATGNPMGLLSSWPVSSLTHHALKQWCASKLGIKKYKYLILGDDSLDTDPAVYNLYCETLTKLGLSISRAKSTQSESACAEFAKRLFVNGTEVTGLPVDLIIDLKSKPEQFLELVRICRERGYLDHDLVPGIGLLISKNRNSKILADVLALPEVATGKPPLLGVRPGGYADVLSQLPADFIESLVAIARNSEFYELVSDLEKGQEDQSHTGIRVQIPENHPMLVGISQKLMLYLDHSQDDEFSIYNAWQRGEYREMAFVPSVDPYRALNKGHFTTRCQYRIFKKTLALANGNCNIPLTRFAPVSNWDLFQRGFPD